MKYNLDEEIKEELRQEKHWLKHQLTLNLPSKVTAYNQRRLAQIEEILEGIKCKVCGGDIDYCCPKPDICCECEEEEILKDE